MDNFDCAAGSLLALAITPDTATAEALKAAAPDLCTEIHFLLTKTCTPSFCDQCPLYHNALFSLPLLELCNSLVVSTLTCQSCLSSLPGGPDGWTPAQIEALTQALSNLVSLIQENAKPNLQIVKSLA